MYNSISNFLRRYLKINSASQLIAGVWLFALFYMLSSLVVLSLVAYQFQHNLHSAEVNGQEISVAKIRSYLRDMKDEEVYYAALKKDYDAKLKNFRSKEREFESLQNNGGDNPESFEADQLAMIADLNTLECQLTGIINKTNDAEIEMVTRQNEIKRSYGFAMPREGGAINSYRAGENETVSVQYLPKIAESFAYSTFTEAAPDPASKCEHVHKEITQADLPLPEVLHPTIDEAIAEYSFRFDVVIDRRNSDLVKFLGPLGSAVFFPFGIDFINIPSDMLTLMVVLIMGALGGTITLARNLLSKKKDFRTAEYIFIPILGGITAFAVYILAKAGVLIIADFGSESGSAISPYFVSFIGLVSGMLSENALATIERTGSTWFKESDSGVKRWGINLQERCQEFGISNEDLSNLTGFSLHVIEGWVDGSRRVDPLSQRLISARMNLPVRELFSDMPPPIRKAEAGDSNMQIIE